MALLRALVRLPRSRRVLIAPTRGRNGLSLDRRLILVQRPHRPYEGS
jgi:hypothetical protein